MRGHDSPSSSRRRSVPRPPGCLPGIVHSQPQPHSSSPTESTGGTRRCSRPATLGVATRSPSLLRCSRALGTRLSALERHHPARSAPLRFQSPPVPGPPKSTATTFAARAARFRNESSGHLRLSPSGDHNIAFLLRQRFSDHPDIVLLPLYAPLILQNLSSHPV